MIGLGTPMKRDVLPKKTLRLELEEAKEGSFSLKPRMLSALYRPELDYCETNYECRGFEIKTKYLYREDVIDFWIENPACAVKVKYCITAADDNPKNTPYFEIDNFVFFPENTDELIEDIINAKAICQHLDKLAKEVYEFAQDPEKFINEKGD